MTNESFLGEMVGVLGALMGSFTFGVGLNRRSPAMLAGGLVLTVLSSRITRTAIERGDI